MENIESLWIQCPVVDDAVVARIATLPRLEFLYLESDRITDSCISALPQLEALRKLVLQGTGVTDAAADVLAQMPKLEMVEIEGISPTAVARLRSAHPRLIFVSGTIKFRRYEARILHFLHTELPWSIEPDGPH